MAAIMRNIVTRIVQFTRNPDGIAGALKKIAGIEKALKQSAPGLWSREDRTAVVRSALSRRFTAELCLYIDLFLDVFPKVFPMPPHGDMLVRWDVTVYKTQAEYLANVKDAPEWSAGLHWVDVAKPFVVSLMYLFR